MVYSNTDARLGGSPIQVWRENGRIRIVSCGTARRPDQNQPGATGKTTADRSSPAPVKRAR